MRTGERFQRVRTVCLLISTLALFVLLVTGCGQAAPEVVEREVVVEKVVEVEKEVPVQVGVEKEVEKIVEAQPAASSGSSQRAAPAVAAAPAAPSGSSQRAAPAVAAAPAAPAGAASQSSQPSQANQNNQADTARTAPRPEPTSVPWDTAAPGAQPMVRAAQDPVSTFSLDTDRASYQRALELANAGHEIDPADVRAEEWINSLAYGYPQPSRSEEFGIFADVFQHPDTQGMHMARIGIQAPELQSRRAVNVTLVLDSSGSMGDENRVEIAREAAYTIVSNLLDGADQVAVVHFEEGVNHSLTVEHTRPSDRDVSRSIGQLRPGGATNVQAGLDQGLRLAYDARARHPGSINYVILFSDGVANVNATDPFAILHNLGEDSEYSRPNPIRIITIGVGIKGYNDQLLEQIAQHGNGWYRYLDDVRDAQATFRHENWIRLINAFADQARAQVTWDPELVGHWRIVGYENRVTADATFTQNLREFAEIPAGTATTVLYELQLTPQVAQRSAATARLGDIEVRWVEPVTGISREQYGTVSGAWRDNFNGLQDQMLRLGVITGLAADVYASLDDGGYGTGGYDAPNRIRILVEEHRTLEGNLGHLQAYRDTSLLLDSLNRRAADYGQFQPRQPRQDSGYSP